MDSSLLAVLRYMGRNNRPDYSKLPLRGPALMWEVMLDLITVSCTPLNFVDHYDDHSVLFATNSHKTKEASEFIKGILKGGQFDWIKYKKKIPLFSSLLLRLFLKSSFPKALRNYLYIRRWYKARITRDFLRYFLYYHASCQKFSGRPPAALVIISDLGARRIALARAARVNGSAVVYYQYWQHHSFRPPFHVDYGICINNLLANRLKDKFGSVIVNRVVFSGSPEDLKFRWVPDNPVVGIATNVYPRSDGINKVAAHLREQFGAANVLYKPHPRNSDSDLRDIQCEIFDKDADIEAFSDQIDLCVCGDTTAVLKILLTGTPCLHLPDLDERPADKYGYVKGAAILGAERVQDVTREDINHFYSNPESLDKIKYYMETNIIINSSKDESNLFLEKMRDILSIKL